MLWDPKQDMLLPSKKHIEGGKYTHQGPHKAALDTFIPMGTLGRFLLSPNIVEIQRNEGEIQRNEENNMTVGETETKRETERFSRSRLAFKSC